MPEPEAPDEPAEPAERFQKLPANRRPGPGPASERGRFDGAVVPRRLLDALGRGRADRGPSVTAKDQPERFELDARVPVELTYQGASAAGHNGFGIVGVAI